MAVVENKGKLAKAELTRVETIITDLNNKTDKNSEDEQILITKQNRKDELNMLIAEEQEKYDNYSKDRIIDDNLNLRFNLKKEEELDYNSTQITNLIREWKQIGKYFRKKSTYTFYEDGAFGEIYLKSPSIQDNKLVKGFDECYHYQSLGYDQPYRFNNLRFPIFNFLLLISMLGVVVYNSFFEIL